MFPATSLPRGTRVRATRALWWGENRLQQNGASYRIRTGVSALATPCLEPTGPTMRDGRGGQSRTVTTSSQDSDANVTPHPEIKIGGTERTRTVIDLIDNQAPHPSATVPLREIWVGRRELNPHAPQSQCGALRIELRPTYVGDK